MNDLERIEIADPRSGSTAMILPSFGFNCVSFVAAAGGRLIETLWSDENVGLPGSRASHSGIPILFPFAGRLPGQSLTWEGVTYPLDLAQQNGGNAIHGFVLNRPWRMIERTTDRVLGEFQASRDDPALLSNWPADFLIRATYTVSGGTLRATYEIENPDRRPLPFGIGTHPYFRLPLGGRSPDLCLITVPALARWDLVEMLPTGGVTPLPADEIIQQTPFADLERDQALVTDLGQAEASGATIVTTIDDPESGLTLTQSFDHRFAITVVYTPSHRQAIAIEPYTTAPNAFALTEAGIDAGLRVLSPGRRFVATIDITLATTEDAAPQS